MPVHAQCQFRLPYINRQHAVVAQAEHREEDIQARLKDTFLIEKDIHECQRRNKNRREEQSPETFSGAPPMALSSYICNSAASSGDTN